MSGFITIYNTNGKTVNEHLLHTLTNSLKFRGPDQQNIWIDKNIGMGHALFKTTFEAEYENMPSSLDGKVWITGSVRIDDRENLIRKMEIKHKIDLAKTPDSDLILHAYRKWGEDCLDHLLGDFAFVIWDSNQQKLFCARDHFGTKQLYYAQKNKSFVICNSLGSILNHPEIGTELNSKAIGGFLLFGDYTWMDKSLTMFSQVRTLLPAHKLVVQNGKTYIQRYWNIPSNVPLLRYRNKKDYIEHFQDIFKQAVIDRIRTSSVTVSMSGGIDSTAIAATISQLQKEQGITSTEVNAVTIVYDHILPCKERHYANLVAKHLDIPIHHMIGDNYPFLKPAINATRPLEISQPSFWLEIEKKFSQFGRVVLTGSSGDNLIRYPSGLSVWKEENIIDIISNNIELQHLYKQRPPLGLRTELKKLFGLGTDKIKMAYPYPKWINPEFEKKVNLKEEWKNMWHSLHKKKLVHSRQATLQWSLSRPDWNTDDILMNSDFTLPEKRDPYLDLRMVELILSLPALPWLFNKHILRQSMEKLLPSEIQYRPKTPLGYLDHALIQRSENNWIKTWKPDPISSNYLKYSELGTVQSFTNEIDDYLASRPITFDLWLRAINNGLTL